jgi:outer membrane protein
MPSRLPLLLLLLPSAAIAQSSTGDVIAKDVDDRWSLGVALSLSDSPYAGEDIRPRPFPLITYNGDRVFWRGLSGGVHVYKGDVFTFDAIVSGRFDGFDIKDLGREELAANGVNIDHLVDRNDGVDVGVSASWEVRSGEFKVRALADATDTSGGYEVAVDYAYPLQIGKTRVVPAVGAKWLSKDVANYYYGTLDEEVARGAPLYRPGASVIPELSVGVYRPIGEKWMFFGSVKYEFLPTEITDSPLMDPDASGAASLRVGFSRGF